MRIAFIVDSFPRLSETFVLNQITGLLDLGHDVRIFPTHHTYETTLHPDVIRYNLLDRTLAMPSPPLRGLRRVLCAALMTLKSLAIRPCWTLKVLLMMKRDWRAFSYQLLRFLLTFPSEPFDVLHCHFGTNGLVALRLRDLGVVGVIGTVFHGHDMSRVVKTCGRDVYRDIFDHGDVFLPISRRWLAKLIELGCPPERTILHHMGVDVKRFEFVPRCLPETGPVKLLNVGRLVSSKGHRYLLEAMRLGVRHNPRIHLTIVGDGPLRQELQRQVIDGGLADHIYFFGAADQDTVRRLMSESQIFVLPSATAEDGNQEGIPVVIMEAMACGMPVVSTFHSGIPELIENGKSGYLVAERDSEALAERILLLTADSSNWVDMGRLARETIVEHFNIEKLNLRLAELYDSMLSAGSAWSDSSLAI